MATTLRFVLLGDDRAGAAFNRFADQVDKSNKSVSASQAALNRNETAMRKLAAQTDKASASAGRSSGAFRQQAKAADQSNKSVFSLVGTVSGFSDVTKVAGKDSSIFAKILGGLNIATGIAEPALAGLLVTAGGVGAAFVAAAAGAGAYMVAVKPLIAATTAVTAAQKKLDTAKTAAQIAYTAALDKGTSQQVAAATRTIALAKAQAQYAAAVKGTPPSVVAFSKSLTKVQDEYKKWAFSLAKPVLAPLQGALKLVRPLLTGITPLVRAGASAFDYLVGKLSQKVKGGGLAAIVADIRPHVIPAIIDLGSSIGNIAAGVWGILKAFLPVSDQITGGVEHLTILFRKWAESLPSHSGFQTLMSIFRGETPLVTGLLKNLVTIIKNVATATTGLASPANSKALLQILTPLSQIMVKLTANQGLVRAVLYFTLLRSSLKQVGGVFTTASNGVNTLTTAFSKAQSAYGVVGRFAGGFRNAAAAESEFSGTAGTLGGKLRTVISSIGTTTATVVKSTGVWIANTASMIASKVAAAAVVIWQKAVTAGQWLLNAAMDANPIGLAVAALAALAAGFYLAYTKSSTFRAIVQDTWAWIKGHWPLLLGILLGPFGIAIAVIIKNWAAIKGAGVAVFDWIKGHWPLLLALLTGPFGLAVLFIVKHWGQITDAARATGKAITSSWSAMTGAIHTAIANVAGFIAARWSDITRAGAAAFGAVRDAGQTAARLVRSAISTLWGVISGVFSKIIHGAADAFGWVPGLGGKLQQAARAFDTWRDNVNNAIKGVQGKTVNVGVKWSATDLSKAGFAVGGEVHGPGTGTSDTAGLFRLSNKEWVVKASSASHYGGAAMKAINDGRASVSYPGMAAGGPVGGNIAVNPVLPSAAVVTTSIDKAVYNLAKVFAKSQGGSGGTIAEYAASFATGQGHPYKWGGVTPAGWDCSGFTSYVLRHFGYSPPRTSQQQQLWAQSAKEQPGALVFFYGTGGTASHVGIALGKGRYVGADNESVGTVIHPDASNSGFGIPPGGFKGGASPKGGGSAGSFLGANAARELGRALAADRGWKGAQWTALDKLWTRESGWNSKIINAKSGAAGIPQDITGNMHGGTRGQILWGLNYIANRKDERTPVGAWAHENTFGWYAKGTGQRGTAPGWSVVGERGAELMYHPTGGATVIPHGQTMSILQGGSRLPGYANGTTPADGGKVPKKDPARAGYLARLARYVTTLGQDTKHAATFRKSQRRLIDVEQLWMLEHPHAKSMAKAPHLRTLSGLQRQLKKFNTREGATEKDLDRKIALLRRLTGYPTGKKYGGPGKAAPDPGDPGDGGDDGGGDTGGSSGGSTSAPAPTFPAPAWLLPYINGGQAGAVGGLPTALAGLFGRPRMPVGMPFADPIGGRFGPRSGGFGEGGASPSGGGGWAEMIDATHQMRREVVAAVRGVAPGTTKGIDGALNKNVSTVAGRFQ